MDLSTPPSTRNEVSPLPLGTSPARVRRTFSALFGHFVPPADAYGTSIYTSQDLPVGTKAVCCPFALAITPTFVRRALPLEFFPAPTSADDDDDHRLMVLYLVLHLLPPSLLTSSANLTELNLAHEPYVSALPEPASIRTPLYFTPQERALLQGTNLDGATRDREQLWQRERDEVLHRVRAPDEVKRAISWDNWLWACTMLSCVRATRTLLYLATGKL